MRSVVDSALVFNPAHYGGKDNPYEAVKVLEHRLSPTEFVGWLKGNIYTYNDRHRAKDGLQDLVKAKWYQDYLVEFIQRNGFDGKTETLTATDVLFKAASTAKLAADFEPLPSLLDTGEKRAIKEAERMHRIESRKKKRPPIKKSEQLDSRGYRIGKRALRRKG